MPPEIERPAWDGLVAARLTPRSAACCELTAKKIRIALDLLIERGLEAEYESRLIAETGNTGFCLAYSEDLDEPSDVEDPEAALRDEVAGLRAEAADRTSMVQAVEGALRARRRSRSPRQSQPRSG